ncbi:DUF7119 family protein [Haloprofundus salinisoli]|uniref:DUF7119 family protein n=1 Tax=Haloprofundus salinisoli TaxID=2876193 RepID=UPI001CCDC6ED|nr:hypothetical protein [Haloprofundus salinisoli]
MRDDPTPNVSPSEADRTSPVGEPVIRSDPAVTGERAHDAVGFNPDDPESVAHAAETVRQFADSSVGSTDNVYMLRGAAACAALVRGVGSYKAAAEEAGGDVSVAFIRKWARVHDLPRSIRRHVALGHIAPTAAKHIARVSGEARFALAWATLDGDLTVREVRRLASAVNDGESVEEALRDHGIELGHLSVSLPPEAYVELRRRASLSDRSPDDVLSDALVAYLRDGEE